MQDFTEEEFGFLSELVSEFREESWDVLDEEPELVKLLDSVDDKIQQNRQHLRKARGG